MPLFYLALSFLNALSYELLEDKDVWNHRIAPSCIDEGVAEKLI